MIRKLPNVRRQLPLHEVKEGNEVAIEIGGHRIAQGFVRELDESKSRISLRIPRLLDSVYEDDLNAVREAVERNTMFRFENKVEFIRFARTSPWARQRIRHVIPEPQTGDLVERVQQVIDAYKDLVNERKQEKLFSKVTPNELASFIGHVRKGCLSDPPRELRVDGLGLTVYHNARGTSSIEGGCHKNRLSSFNTSPQWADALIGVQRCRRIVDTCTRHGSMYSKIGHYNIRLSEYINELGSLLYDSPAYPGWTQVTLFKSTQEQFGVGPLNMTHARQAANNSLVQPHRSLNPK